MNKFAFRGADIYTPDRRIENGTLLVSEGRVEAIDPTRDLQSSQDYLEIDARQLIITPGFIDAQTHGGNGYDFMESTPEQIAGIMRWMASTGVTGALPTIATCSLADQLQYIRNLCQVQQKNPPGTAILGIHLEGPYISREHHGAQPSAFIRDPSIPEIEQAIQASQGIIRLITLAPELPGALEFINHVTSQGIVAAVGHSDATYEQVIAAADAGLSRATHLFNAMTGLHHRQPGVVGAALVRDDLYAEIILDGEHVHPVAVQVAIRAKGLSRIVLVTDATQAAGLKDGVYVRPGDRKIIVQDGAARLESGILAGSVLTLDQAVRNAVHLLGLSLPDAFAIASRIPAESLGLGGLKGSLAPGRDADLLVLSPDLHVLLTLVRGQVAYQDPVFSSQLPTE
jgi:N-acetylglucosamine-6-phosphate deacetylase